MASELGAKLDSDLLLGGGSDDTAVLQEALDRGRDGRNVHLIIDGPARVTGLDVYSDTVLECSSDGGLFLADDSGRALVRNAHRTRGEMIDRNIELRGGFYNGNRSNQPSADIPRPDIDYPYPSNKEPDGTFMSALQFMGVHGLKVESLTIWASKAFGATIGNARRVVIKDVLVDHGRGPDVDPAEVYVTDGFHFKGPLQFVSIETVSFRVGDDGLAFNANDFETDDITIRNDFGPYVGQGPITDVDVNGVTFLPGQYAGIRILSTSERVDRITINNVSGSVKNHLLQMTRYVNPGPSRGNVGSVALSNIHVDRWECSERQSTQLIMVDTAVESLTLQSLETELTSGLQFMRFGPQASVAALDAEVIVLDPTATGGILEISSDAIADDIRIALDWRRPAGSPAGQALTGQAPKRGGVTERNSNRDAV